jgi:hypothetical protein
MEERRFKHEIANYRTDKRNPIDEFIESKNEKGRAKIWFCQDLLKEKGPELRRPYAAYLRDKIWGVKAGNKYRGVQDVLFLEWKDCCICSCFG